MNTNVSTLGNIIQKNYIILCNGRDPDVNLTSFSMMRIFHTDREVRIRALRISAPSFNNTGTDDAVWSILVCPPDTNSLTHPTLPPWGSAHQFHFSGAPAGNTPIEIYKPMQYVFGTGFIRGGNSTGNQSTDTKEVFIPEFILNKEFGIYLSISISSSSSWFNRFLLSFTIVE